jgi:hypothetical protein
MPSAKYKMTLVLDFSFCIFRSEGGFHCRARYNEVAWT